MRFKILEDVSIKLKEVSDKLLDRYLNFNNYKTDNSEIENINCHSEHICNSYKNDGIIEIPKILNVNKAKYKFTTNITDKDNLTNPTDKFIASLFNNMNLNLPTPESIAKQLSILKNISYDDALNVIKDNYDSIINNINVNSYISDYIFNKSNFYYNNVIKIIVRSIDFVCKKLGMFINTNILSYLLESAFIFNSGKNFGIIYQTNKYICNKLLISNTALVNTMRKLEFLGLISYVSSDNNTQNQNINEYLEQLSKSSNTCVYNHYNRMYETEETKFDFLLFPVLNFDVISCFIVDHYKNEVLSNVYKEINYHIYSNLDMINQNINEYLNKFSDDFIKNNEHIKAKKAEVQGNVLQEYGKYKQYIESRDKYGFPILSNNFEDFFDERMEANKHFDLNLVMEDFYLMKDWIEMLYKDNYREIKNKEIKYIDIKKYNISDDFISITDDIFETQKYSHLMTKNNYFKDKMLYNIVSSYHKGILDYAFYKRFGKKFVSYDDITKKGNLIKKEDLNMNLNILKIIKYKSEKLVNDFTSHSVPTFELIRKAYFNVNNKKEFIQVLYKTFVNRSKSPAICCRNYLNMLNYIESHTIASNSVNKTILEKSKMSA